MKRFKKWGHFITVLLLIATFVVLPAQTISSTKPLEQMEDKLTSISAEERVVLEKLFSISQKIEEMKREEEVITADIDTLQPQITELQEEISKKQQDYDFQLDILGSVLVNYQRGGAGSYLEILFKAESLSKFLKGLNVLKNLSHNVGNLLYEIEEGQIVLQEEKAVLDEKAGLLEDKKAELLENLHKNEQLKHDQEQYLLSLQGDMVYYQEQLLNLESVWGDCKKLFAELLEDITRIIESDHYALEHMYISFDFFKMQGALGEDTFNKIIKEYSKFPDTIFQFKKDKVILEFPNKNLVLTGNFVLVGDSAIEFEVTSGTFYKFPLDQGSIKELFQQGPLLIDFKAIVDDFIFDISISKIHIQEGRLVFQVGQ